MDYARLGNSGLQVSKLCLGVMMFGGLTGNAAAARIIAMARDADVNFIDTADGYNAGASERVVGRLVKGDRDRWVIATKAASPMGPGPLDRGCSRSWLMRAIDGSLGRLGTDRVDLWYLHKEDHDTPLEETVAAIGDIIRAGKVRYWGVSNYRAWRIAEMVNCAHRLGVPPPTACQPYYNAMNRMPEIEVLPACDFYGISVVPYSPLARGVLTGKYGDGNMPTGSRAKRGDRRMHETEFRTESLKMAQRIRKHAEKGGGTAIAFALQWVLNNSLVSSVIAGPRTATQWKAYLDAMQVPFSAADEKLINKLVAPGHPSTPGYNDPQYPIEGRPVDTD